MRQHRLFLSLALLLLAACVAHDKAGDRAASVGDWKSAYGEYRQAVQDKPDDPVLRQKLAEARVQALAWSTSRARACAAQESWDCALVEADFVLSVDAGNVEMASLRRTAADAVAQGRVSEARAQIARGQLGPAADGIRAGLQLSSAPPVVSAARAAIAEWERAAIPQSDQLRAARRWPEAIALLQAGVSIDPTLQPRLDAAAREYEAWRTAEHDRLIAEGVAFGEAGRWAEAADRFHAAQELRPDPRARALERYARLVVAGDQAIAGRDWAGATRAFQEAAALDVDRTGYARAQLARVTLRPYAIRVKSVLVTPLRPDGMPWVGPRTPGIERAQSVVARAWGRPVGGDVVLALDRVPPVNRPAVAVELALPDGRRLTTSPARSLLVAPEAVVVIATNGFDPRRIGFRILHRHASGAEESIAFGELGVADLVARRAVVVQDRAGLLEVTADPADGAVDGTFSNLYPVAPGGPPPPRPAPRT
jgi:tetratricopeptide (TPR) repeat protein